MKVYLGIGSNLGNRMENLETAWKTFHIEKRSSVYETEPVDVLQQPWFLNMVIEIKTDESPRELLQHSQKIESEMGRTRNIPKGPRTIDIDILFYNDLVIAETDLIIPHPEIPYRRFVLEPLNEIAPTLIHPVLRSSVADLLKKCTDTSAVRKWLNE
jgi:2-amino-4-hydroxy-6-hydroxymethyldihydropteridine diphosphokinase